MLDVPSNLVFKTCEYSVMFLHFKHRQTNLQNGFFFLGLKKHFGMIFFVSYLSKLLFEFEVF